MLVSHRRSSPGACAVSPSAFRELFPPLLMSVLRFESPLFLVPHEARMSAAAAPLLTYVFFFLCAHGVRIRAAKPCPTRRAG